MGIGPETSSARSPHGEGERPMCRHLKALSSSLGGPPDQDAKREVGDSLGDIEEGLELSRKLLLLADGHWRECGHGGGLVLEGILRDCAHSIAIEAMRSRMALEASGRVNFGSVVIEAGVEFDNLHPVTAFQRGARPFLESPLHDSSGRLPSGISPEVSSRKSEPYPLVALRRLCAGFLALPSPGGPRWSAAGPRQKGR